MLKNVVMHLGSRNKRIEYHMHKEGVQVNLQTTEPEMVLVCILTPSYHSVCIVKKGKYGQQAIRPDQIICVP